MVIQNNTAVEYWFGPISLPPNATITIDDITDTSLYLTDDTVADAINTLSETSPALITVTPTTGTIFPRATGTPTILHGDGSPQGLVYGPQGSIYLRRDSTAAPTTLYVKNSGVTLNTGWNALGPQLGAAAFATPGNASTTVTAHYVMAGDNFTFTPQASGNVKIFAAGTYTPAGASGLILAYGTGTPPTAGATATGTILPGNNAGYIGSTTAELQFWALLTGLTLGTSYWIDYQFISGNGGTASITAQTMMAFE